MFLKEAIAAWRYVMALYPLFFPGNSRVFDYDLP